MVFKKQKIKSIITNAERCGPEYKQAEATLALAMIEYNKMYGQEERCKDFAKQLEKLKQERENRLRKNIKERKEEIEESRKEVKKSEKRFNKAYNEIRRAL